MTTLYDVEKKIKQIENITAIEKKRVDEASSYADAEDIYMNSKIPEIREMAFRKMIIFSTAK